MTATGTGRRPTVGVVVPCYNYGHLLAACLDSVLAQEGVDVSVLIVDDASPDGSAAVAKELASADPRVELLEHGVNAGHIQTYNDGLERIEADYTVLLSADDMLTPGALKRATDLMEANPTVGFVYGYSRYFDGDTIPPLQTGPARTRVYRGEDWIAHRCRSATNIISSPEVVVRTSLQREVGGYRADLPHAGDLEMWLRLAAHMDVGVITGADQALYRVHPQSMSRTTFAAPVADLRQRYRAFEVFFATCAARLTRTVRLQDDAARATARKVLWRASRLQRNDPAQARELADFAFATWSGVGSTAEGRAWRWATGPQPAPRWTRLPVVATALRGRVEEWRYWRNRERRCM